MNFAVVELPKNFMTVKNHQTAVNSCHSFGRIRQDQNADNIRRLIDVISIQDHRCHSFDNNAGLLHNVIYDIQDSRGFAPQRIMPLILSKNVAVIRRPI